MKPGSRRAKEPESQEAWKQCIQGAGEPVSPRSWSNVAREPGRNIAREPGSRGAREPWSQGARELESQEAREPESQEARDSLVKSIERQGQGEADLGTTLQPTIM